MGGQKFLKPKDKPCLFDGTPPFGVRGQITPSLAYLPVGRIFCLCLIKQKEKIINAYYFDHIKKK